jgi:O-antigen/teichoic acid export membrane protein
MSHRKIYQNTIAQILGKLATAIISIFLIKILTNYLDVAGYGLYSKVYNYLSIFAVIADLGLYTITVREIAEQKENEKKIESILWNVLTLRTIMGIIIIILSSSLAFFLPGYDSLMARIGILVTGVFTLFGLINSSIMSYLQATLQTEKSAIANTGGKLLTLWLIVLFATTIAPIESSTEITRYTLVMIAWLLWNIAMTTYTYSYARKLVQIRFHYDTAYIREIIQKSLPYWIALFLNVIFFKVDVLILSFMESREVADISIALYSVPMKIVEVGMMYGTIFLNSLLPELTTNLKKNDQVENPEYLNILDWKMTQSVDLIEKWYKILLFFWVGISAFLYSFPKEILTIISSEKYISTTSMWYSSVDALMIVSWIFTLYFLSSLATYIMIARSDEKKMIYINLFIALCNIGGNILLIPYYSFYGAAIATLVSQVFLLILTSWQVKSIIAWKKLSIFSCYIILLAILCIIMSNFLTWGIANILILGCTIFSIVYWGWIIYYIKYINNKSI